MSEARSGLEELNPRQREAAAHGLEAGQVAGPLLVIAGAGSGKTKTLAHRVAQLILHGADPSRILLLTFTRRAADEMTRRAQALVARERKDGRRLMWAGTFHSVANRLLRLHASEVGLDPAFTIMDKSDAADLLDVIRQEQGLAKTDRRFPKKGTCLAIYSRVVNAQESLETCLSESFPWCKEHAEALKGLFRAYVAAKQARAVLDYDDLLLYWFHLMQAPGAAKRVGGRFDHILVDEYQDTNALQEQILLGLKPDGVGLTVVGDDAQAIYSFRGSTVENILAFPKRFSPQARVVTLEHNYRSTQTILESANAVIRLSPERYTKDLFSTRPSKQRPRLVSVEDEAAQVDYVVERVLDKREQGIALKRQAVLFRTAHHSDALELELARRQIPFHKYGGLKFLEAAHVKDLLCFLRWAENPKDELAAFRVLQLSPGIGPGLAKRAWELVASNNHDLSKLSQFLPPASAREQWGGLVSLLRELRDGKTPWESQVARVRAWYQPQLERLYDGAHARAMDLDQLEQLSTRAPSRERFLSDLSLDPPDATSDDAGPPVRDEDYLVLSTIHSAKGQEWDAVYLLSVVDGAIPSDMATGHPRQIEEERRLLYVAMTRAKDELHLVQPQRMFVKQQHRFGDRYLFAPRSRFLEEQTLPHFERFTYAPPVPADAPAEPAKPVDVAAKLRSMWG